MGRPEQTDCRNRLPMRVGDIPEIARMSTAEKILLVEDLWDSISADEATVLVHPGHKIELDRRLEVYESAPENLLSLAELCERLDPSG